MIRLTTFGTPSLARADVRSPDPILAQPKRALLLAYLALARPRGFHRRESLLALFWPELNDARGRQSLRQTVYMLRRELRREVVAGRGDAELALDTDRLWVDALAFEQELALGREAAALALYRGEFLAGLHAADGSAELEHWVDEARRAYRRNAAGAAWALSRREEAAGNRVAAAHWGRSAAGFDPDDEASIREVIRLLIRLGDRPGAVRVHEEYASRLRTLFDLEPAAELRELLRQPPTERPVAEAPSAPVVTTAPPEPAGDRAAPIAPGWRPGRWGWGVLAIAGALLLALAWPRLQPPGAEQVFAVGEFRDVSRPDSVIAAPIVSDLLATSLSRIPALQVLSGARLVELRSQLGAPGRRASAMAAARAGGATHLAQGGVLGTATGWRLSLQVVDIGSGRIGASIEVEGRDLFDLVDRATAAMAEHYGASPPPQPVAAVTTGSVVAYRFYEEGLRAYYAGDRSAARRLFDAALAEDSSFAMAAYFGSRATDPGPAHDRVLDLARRLSDRVSERERLLIRATWHEERQDPEAVAAADSLLARFPRDPEAHRLHGSIALIQGDFATAVRDLRRAIVMDSLSLAAGTGTCTACEAYHALVFAWLQADSLPTAEAVAREWIARRPADAPARYALLQVLDWSASPALAVAIRETQALTGFDERLTLAQAAIRAGEPRAAEPRLRQLLQEGEPAARDEAAWFLVICLRDQGRLEEAAAVRPLDEGLRAMLLLEQGRYPEAERYYLARAEVMDTSHGGHAARNRTWALTHVATALARTHDTLRLGSLVGAMQRAGERSLYGRDHLLHHYVRGLLARARGDRPAAVAEFRAAVYSWNAGYTRINVELAGTLLELGQPAEAVRVLQPALRGSLEASNLFASRTEIHALLARAFRQEGSVDSAAAHEAWVARVRAVSSR